MKADWFLAIHFLIETSILLWVKDLKKKQQLTGKDKNTHD